MGHSEKKGGMGGFNLGSDAPELSSPLGKVHLVSERVTWGILTILQILSVALVVVGLAALRVCVSLIPQTLGLTRSCSKSESHASDPQGNWKACVRVYTAIMLLPVSLSQQQQLVI